jgi:hypothetical protein
MLPLTIRFSLNKTLTPIIPSPQSRVLRENAPQLIATRQRIMCVRQPVLKSQINILRKKRHMSADPATNEAPELPEKSPVRRRRSSTKSLMDPANNSIRVATINHWKSVAGHMTAKAALNRHTNVRVTMVPDTATKMELEATGPLKARLADSITEPKDSEVAASPPTHCPQCRKFTLFCLCHIRK